MFGVLFVIYCCVFVSNHHCLVISLFKKIQDYKEEDLEQQQAGSKASVP
jgi:hypothetical protein